MQIRLRPETEAMIREDIQRGPYQTADEFVERAVSLLHEQEKWLARHKGEIEAQIIEGYAAAQRGELIGAEKARLQLDGLKRKRLGEVRK
jgi:Arc/MetJ-type ribon-helix-helix transcriptional regulator